MLFINPIILDTRAPISSVNSHGCELLKNFHPSRMHWCLVFSWLLGTTPLTIILRAAMFNGWFHACLFHRVGESQRQRPCPPCLQLDPTQTGPGHQRCLMSAEGENKRMSTQPRVLNINCLAVPQKGERENLIPFSCLWTFHLQLLFIISAPLGGPGH
jgi:hypothetical protein